MRRGLAALACAICLAAGCGGGKEEEEEKGSRPLVAKGEERPADPAPGGGATGSREPRGETPTAKPIPGPQEPSRVQIRKLRVLGTPRKPHVHGVTAIRMHPDGKNFVTSSLDGTVGVWSLADGTRRHTLVLGETVQDVAIRTDGKSLVAADRRKATVWTWGSWLELGTHPVGSGPADEPYRVVFAGDRLVLSGSWRGLALAPRGEIPNPWARSQFGHKGLAQSADGRLFAAAYNAGPVAIYDAHTLARESELQGPKPKGPSRYDLLEAQAHAQAVAVAFDGTGTRLATCSPQMGIRVWEVRTGRLLRWLGNTTKGFRGVAFSPVGDLVASADGEPTGRIHVFNAKTGAKAAELAGFPAQVTALAFTLDGKRLLSGDQRGRLAWWSLPEGAPAGLGAGHSGPVKAVLWSPRGDRVWSAGRDGRIIRWSAASGAPEAVWQQADELNALALSEAAAYAGGARGTLFRQPLDGSPARQLQRFEVEGRPVEVNAVAVAGEQWLLAGADQGLLAVVDPRSGDVRKRWLPANESHAQTVLSIAVAPDGSYVLTGGGDTAIRRWLPGSWERVRGSAFGMSHVRGLDIARDGRHVIAGARELAGRLDLHTAQGLRNHNFPRQTVNAVALRPDGGVVAAGLTSADQREGRVVLLVPDQDDPYASVAEHLGPVLAARFSPDGKLLATGSADGTVILWEAAGG